MTRRGAAQERLIEARDLLEVAIILPLLLICAPLAAIMTMDAIAAGVFKR